MINFSNLALIEASSKDSSLIFDYIKKLAELEKRPDDVTGSLQDLEKLMFEDKVVHSYIIEYNQEPIGYILYYLVFSSFRCCQSVYLEDFFIDEKLRHQGIGRWVFFKFKDLMKQKGFSKILWSCLDWNVEARRFYNHIKANKEEGRVHFEFDI